MSNKVDLDFVVHIVVQVKIDQVVVKIRCLIKQINAWWSKLGI